MMIVWQQLRNKPGLRKNYYLDEKKFAGQGRFWARRQDRAIDAAWNLVVFRKEILKSLEKMAGKAGVEKVF